MPDPSTIKESEEELMQNATLGVLLTFLLAVSCELPSTIEARHYVPRLNNIHIRGSLLLALINFCFVFITYMNSEFDANNHQKALDAYEKVRTFNFAFMFFEF